VATASITRQLLASNAVTLYWLNSDPRGKSPNLRLERPRFAWR